MGEKKKTHEMGVEGCTRMMREFGLELEKEEAADTVVVEVKGRTSYMCSVTSWIRR